MKIITTIFLFVVIASSVTQARPQTSFNNYPFRPTFSDLDTNNYYTTAMPYQQNVMRIWPYIIDRAVSPLYNWNWNNANNGYHISPYGSGNNFNKGYYNFAYGYTTTTSSPYLYNYNRFGTFSG